MQDWNWQGLLPILECLAPILTGTFCAYLAKQRGRRPFLWMLLGVFFGILGIIVLCLLPKKGQTSVPPALSCRQKRPIFPSLSSKPHKLWHYLDANNQPQGPMSLYALLEIWQKKQISFSTYVWNEDMADWKLMQDTPEIINQIEENLSASS